MPARLANQEEPLPGYRLLERLGRGGFGEVWKVEAPGGIHKAMKFVFGDLDAAEDDGRPAEQELKALHRVKTIRHPYILSLERFDIVDGQLIIVMELADRNLWDRFRECRAQGLTGIPRAELMRYMEESAEALDLMNDHYQIQHLDIKPQNIFLVHNHIKVADFGLAKLFEGERATVTGGVTPVYAAPETFEGWISRFTDQYSLAIVYQELLTGTRPFTGANTKQLMLQHLSGTPELGPLPAGDKAAIARALGKTPNERFPTCTALVRALRAAEAEPGAGPPPMRSSGPVPVPTARPTVPPAPAPSPTAVTVSPTRPASTPASAPAITPRPEGALPGLITPGLSTPRLVTPQGMRGPGAAPAAPAATLARPQILQTARMTAVGIAPPERQGGGALVPALLVAAGRTGLQLLLAFRQALRERFGSPDPLPHVRFLFVDTDPETAALATQGPDGLSPRDVVLARLNRPAHYLQREGLPSVEQWLPPGLLYRLPRTPGPAAGVRAFGRLALADHYRVVAQRLRQEIETFLSDAPLDEAAAKTGLGVRSNRARVTVLAGLAGGTGGGMAIDLAYLARHELRQVGYRRPEVGGLLVLPPADRAASRPQALANAHAALAEIAAFGPVQRYQAKWDAAEAPIVDAEPPFAPLALLTLPRSGKSRDANKVIGTAARALALELASPAGRVLDAARAAGAPPAGPSARVFGLYRLHWPRQELLTVAARRFSARLLHRWAARDSAHLREPIRLWLDEQWQKQRLDPVSVSRHYQKAVETAVGDPAETVFAQATESLRPSALTPGETVDPDAAVEVLDKLLRLVGKPGDKEMTGSLAAVVRDSNRKLTSDAEASLAAFAVSFVEQPQYRLAGSEEALAQIRSLLDRTVAEIDASRVELQKSAQELYHRLLHLIGSLSAAGGGLHLAGGRRAAAVSAELLEVVADFPARQLLALQADAALLLYRGLLGNMPEFQRDVNFCRQRLEELSAKVAGPPAGRAHGNPGSLILPDGCSTLEEGADLFLSQVPAQDILEFDQKLQVEVKRRFRGVASVCLKPDRVPDFLALLDAEARPFLDARLEHADPAAVLIRHRGEGDVLTRTLADAAAEAAPDLDGATGPIPPELALLAGPAGAATDAVRRAAEAACPGAGFVATPGSEELVLYRECPAVPLATLPHQGDVCRDAYRAQRNSDAPPHARADVRWPGD